MKLFDIYLPVKAYTEEGVSFSGRNICKNIEVDPCDICHGNVNRLLCSGSTCNTENTEIGYECIFLRRVNESY